MIVLVYKEGNYSFIAGLTNYTDEEIVTDLKSHIDEMLSEGVGDDFEITTLGVIGSRAKGDDSSDLDVVIEYKGDYREDDVFEALNSDSLFIDDIEVDFIPFSVNKGNEIKYQPFYNEMIVLYENEPIIKERDNWLERS